LVFVKTSRYD